MATPTSTKPSGGSSAVPEGAARQSDRLVLPVDRGFYPEAPTVDLSVLMERSSDVRRWLPEGVLSESDRLAAKCEKEFSLSVQPRII